MEVKKFNKLIKKVRKSYIEILTESKESISRSGTEFNGSFEDDLFECYGDYELYVKISAWMEYSDVEGGDWDERITDCTNEGECEVEEVDFYFKGDEVEFTDRQKKRIIKELEEITEWR